MTGLPCVRCARAWRADGTYLCDRCLADPDAKREAEDALNAAPADPRTYVLRRYKWAGGWRIGGDHARA